MLISSDLKEGDYCVKKYIIKIKKYKILIFIHFSPIIDVLLPNTPFKAPSTHPHEKWVSYAL